MPAQLRGIAICQQSIFLSYLPEPKRFEVITDFGHKNLCDLEFRLRQICDFKSKNILGLKRKGALGRFR